MTQQMNTNYSIVNTTTDDLILIYWMFEEAITYQKKEQIFGLE